MKKLFFASVLTALYLIPVSQAHAHDSHREYHGKNRYYSDHGHCQKNTRWHKKHHKSRAHKNAYHKGYHHGRHNNAHSHKNQNKSIEKALIEILLKL